MFGVPEGACCILHLPASSPLIRQRPRHGSTIIVTSPIHTYAGNVCPLCCCWPGPFYPTLRQLSNSPRRVLTEAGMVGKLLRLACAPLELHGPGTHHVHRPRLSP